MIRHLSLSDVERLARSKSPAELIDALSGAAFDGRVFSSGAVVIAPGLLPSMGSLVQQLLPTRSNVVLMDVNTREAAGESLLTRLPGHVEPIVLSPPEGLVHVTPHMDAATDLLIMDLACDAIIAVGGGTINDLAKYTAFLMDVPYLVVATAPSMNGYTSSAAALVEDGLKSSIPCAPPVAVLADVDVLAAAPADMLSSGFADLLSMFSAGADWLLSSLVVDVPFSPLPGWIVHSALDRCISEAEAIKERDVGAVSSLMESLILSGFAMAAVGSSAPASGGEHLISHYLDMVAYQNDRLPAPHGHQVGLGTLLTSRLYDLAAERSVEELIPPSRYAPHPSVHGALWPAVRSEAEKQRMDPGRMSRRSAAVMNIWEDILGAVNPVRMSFADILRCLVRAGAPCSPTELGSPPTCFARRFSTPRIFAIATRCCTSPGTRASLVAPTRCARFSIRIRTGLTPGANPCLISNLGHAWRVA